MTLESLGSSTVGRWSAVLLQRARGAVIGLALAGIFGVLASHLALAMKWLDLFHYACWVAGSLALYALALLIGHLGNASEPTLTSRARPAPPQLRRLNELAH